MAKFWVGGSGNWNDSANHWASSSGGSPGAGVPGAGELATIDSSSLSAGSRTITFNVSPNCGSIDFSGASVVPIIGGTNTALLTGDLVLRSGMSWPVSVQFTTTGVTCNLTSNGATVGTSTSNSIITTGVGGTFNFLDNITSSGNFRPGGSGTINTNNNTINVAQFRDNAGTNAINLGSSSITCTTAVDAWNMNSGVSLNAGTSTITLTANSAEFDGAGLSYYDVVFTGSPAIITGCNTYHKLTGTPGKTINFPNTCTQTIGTLNAIGTSGSKITFATTGGDATHVATLSVTTDQVDYVIVSNNSATNPIYNEHGTDSGNNTNWFFTARPTAQGGFLSNFI